MDSLYQLYDIKAQVTAGPIMNARRDAPAIREFHGVLNNKQTMPGQHPTDFILLKLGQQDTDTGQINAIEPETVATGEQWQESQRALTPDSEGLPRST